MIGNLTDQEALKIMRLTVEFYFEGYSFEECIKKATEQFRKEKGCSNSPKSK